VTVPQLNEEVLFTVARLIGDGAARALYLRQASAGDEALLRRVEALLAIHDAPDRLLDNPVVPTPAGDETRTGPRAASDAAESLDFLAPSDKLGSLGRLDHYEIVEVVGRGGMGLVLKAFDEKLHRVVAVKVMAPQLATSATARKRFAREARAAAAIRNEHVVNIHAVEDFGPLPYLVMEYITGPSLQDRLDKNGALQVAEILRIGMQAALGLAAAHAQGLIHRDVKPSNILLENGVERVKITDFGLARAVDDASLTQSGTVAGTPQYMAPEQARGEAVDHRADLFSLGSVLYAMCTGRAPFRASGTMAVLKRVCEDEPRSIREVAPETPEWLIAIIAKLQTKAPADRFQSAGEIAELLGKYLAHIQQPALIQLPSGAATRPRSVKKGAQAPEVKGNRRRWIAAAAVVLTVVAGLGATEATGVTRVRAAIIRVFTPDGTLVVEVNDPDVKVTVEGDGGIVITGAGLQEVRLKPGSYKVHALKDGKPVRLDRELVTITRGDKQVVRVRLEGEAAAAKTAVEGERDAFVLLSATGVFERKFATLAEAVRGSSDGDTIEIHGNGPFVCAPISISNALTIRAGKGFRPRIIRAEIQPRDDFLLETVAPLNLEGLELESPDFGDQLWRSVVICRRTSVQAANCRFLVRGEGFSLNYGDSLVAVARNCEFYVGPNPAAMFGNSLPAGAQRIMENCVVARATPMGINYSKSNGSEISVRLIHNTIVTNTSPVIYFELGASVKTPAANQKRQPITIELSSNILHASNIVFIRYFTDEKAIDPVKAEAAFRLLVEWHEHQNLESLNSVYLASMLAEGQPNAARFQNRAEWERFWGSDHTGAQEGRVRYQGGDLLARLAREPEKLGPDDFRLRPDSAGYRAGKDGKDLGADIDLVGPGSAYERWKKTPEYRQWLKDTGQVKK
jgi:hypothetical protein